MLMMNSNVKEHGSMNVEDLPLHHKKLEYCLTRKSYRKGRRKTAVKVFTVNCESKYLVVMNVHATGLEKDLVKLCTKYGAVDRCQDLKDYPKEPFTQVFLVKFQHIQSARMAKRHLDEMYFYGSMLHVFHAPEYETVDEARQKLLDRRAAVVSRVKSLIKEERKLKQGQDGAKSTKSYNGPKASTSQQRNKTSGMSDAGTFMNLTSTMVQQNILPNSSLLPHDPHVVYGVSNQIPIRSAPQGGMSQSSILVKDQNLKASAKKKPKFVQGVGYTKNLPTCNFTSGLEMKAANTANIVISTPKAPVVAPGLVPRVVHLKRPRQPEKLHLMGDLESHSSCSVTAGSTEESHPEKEWQDDYIYMDAAIKETAVGIKRALKRTADKETNCLNNFKVKK